jgi:hypothetical protein
MRTALNAHTSDIFFSIKVYVLQPKNEYRIQLAQDKRMEPEKIPIFVDPDARSHENKTLLWIPANFSIWIGAIR